MRRIRAAGVETPIYLLGATWSEEREETPARDWTPCISSLDEADHLPVILAQLERLEHLEVEGIGSHLPSADEDEEFTHAQFARFRAIIAELGGPARSKWIHLANSAGLLGYEPDICNHAGPHPAGRPRRFLRPAVRHHPPDVGRDCRHRLWRRLPAPRLKSRRGRLDPRSTPAGPRADHDGSNDGRRHRRGSSKVHTNKI
ncbi:MAG: alanine racemase [Akkermansiaceae bacterium]